jgi:hypothetical protein
MAVLTSSFYTCPDVCPFKRNGCYGDSGPLRLQWDLLNESGLTFPELLERLKEEGNGQFIRLFQAGDMPGSNNCVNFRDVRRLVRALECWQAFGYTHKPLHIGKNAEAIKHCNDRGVCINLSANNLVHADELIRSGVGPVVVTLPKESSFRSRRTPEGNKVVICRAVSNRVQCSTCGGRDGPLCSRVNRNFIVGFPAHGSGANRVSEVVRYGI